ncbi:MAG: hypothetical protein U0359_25005 [Byssovorax sp.]
MTQVNPKDIFLFSQKRTVLVRLPSFEWNFTPGARVWLQANDQVVETRQIGTGNHEGRATILLLPTGDWELAQATLRMFMTSSNTVSVIEEAGATPATPPRKP